MLKKKIYIRKYFKNNYKNNYKINEENNEENNEEKSCIAVLTRGYSNIAKYKDLINRNKSINNNLKDKNIPLIIFHEGNINKDHQNYIIKHTPNLKIIFINISNKCFSGKKIDYKPYPPSVKPGYGFTLNYRHMCSFWFIDFISYLDEYDYMLRIDEDCIVNFNIDNKFNLLKNKTFIYGYWYLDYEFVTHKLNDTTLEFLNQNKDKDINHLQKRDVYGPYTNLIFINLKKIREKDIINKYLKHVEKGEYIYIYRWGDLPLWGQVIMYMIEENQHLLDRDLKYYHGSHRKKIN